VLTRTGKIPVNTARHDFNRQAVPTNAAMKANIVKPIVNRVNTAEVNAVSAVGGKMETADYPHRALKHKGIVDSGCSRHMIGNKVSLSVKQKEDGIFISQDKYVAEILKKFDFVSVKTASTPIERPKSLSSRMRKLVMWMYIFIDP
ncbi:hypothetical protein Tco_0124468, partial [Tanacetum coccineum]